MITSFEFLINQHRRLPFQLIPSYSYSPVALALFLLKPTGYVMHQQFNIQ